MYTGGTHLDQGGSRRALEVLQEALRHFKAQHALVRELTDEGGPRHTKRLALGLELERLHNAELAHVNARLEPFEFYPSQPLEPFGTGLFYRFVMPLP